MASSTSPWPVRVHNVGEAHRQFGDLLERLVPFLEVGDPAADQALVDLAELSSDLRHRTIRDALDARDSPRVPASLRALVAHAHEVPPWVDWQRIERAGALFRRAGVLGGITLGLRSLVFGYAAPAGNKPLAFSGRLTQQADRRLAETGRFVSAVCAPGGLLPGALGWQLCLEVRLMHAQVRRLLLASGRWSEELWSLPINQHDMMATILLFSKVFVDGLRLLGLHVSARDADDYQHQWRWAGVLLGVHPELIPATYQEASRLAELVRVTQGAPDDDSRALVRALLEGPRRRVALSAHQPPPASLAELRRRRLERRLAEAHVIAATALCRSLVGDDLADALDLPRTPYRHVARGVRSLVQALDGVRRRSERLDDAAQQLGARYWEFSVAQGLGGLPAVYALPERLGRP